MSRRVSAADREHNDPVPAESDPFVAVYSEYLRPISAYLARRVDRDQVEDLAADVFAIAWRKRDSVTPGEELPWLYRIASFTVANHRRRLASRTSLLARLTTQDSAPSAEDIVVADAALADAWRQLSARDREILALGVVEGLGAQDVGIALGISANAASIRLHRARARLAAALAEKSDTA
ncbi:RNA polymerase sigma-70 factor (ECF subfamily) [Microcella alkaliphila]|uniref:RNA polymerase sigma-70 factor (ECF subfamily) n=1 Tax=Microcella alkaliphila TaxID=279828 RepID=A0A4Q7TCT6_9MICO|nr:RNA polymerase sigma-70 factor (ECF subfamily) [Microcella alkaliphila]